MNGGFSYPWEGGQREEKEIWDGSPLMSLFRVYASYNILYGGFANSLIADKMLSSFLQGNLSVIWLAPISLPWYEMKEGFSFTVSVDCAFEIWTSISESKELAELLWVKLNLTDISPSETNMVLSFWWGRVPCNNATVSSLPNPNVKSADSCGLREHCRPEICHLGTESYPLGGLLIQLGYFS